MGATSKWFCLMLGEKNDALLPVYNRAIDIVGAMRLAFMFSLIDEHLEKRSRFALKDNGQLRTRGGVAIQLMKSLPSSGYIFGRTERERNSALNGTCHMGNLELNLLPPLERQGAFLGTFADRVKRDLSERPPTPHPSLPNSPDSPRSSTPLFPAIPENFPECDFASPPTGPRLKDFPSPIPTSDSDSSICGGDQCNGCAICPSPCGC